MNQDDPSQFLGYFSLTPKGIFAKNAVSKTKLKMLKANDERVIKSYLIGQIGKNSSIPNNPVNLKILLDYAFTIIRKAQHLVGGSAIALECENSPSLISLYEQHGFKYLQIDENDGLVTMYTKLKR